MQNRTHAHQMQQNMNMTKKMNAKYQKLHQQQQRYKMIKFNFCYRNNGHTKFSAENTRSSTHTHIQNTHLSVVSEPRLNCVQQHECARG